MNQNPTMENASENLRECTKINNPKKTFKQLHKEQQNKLLEEVFEDD